MKKGYIYKITNLINGKIYIGKSTRCGSYDLRTYFGSGIVINLAFKKYGKENFKKEILEMISFEDEAELDALETAYIKKFDAMNEAVGYNRSEGGEGGTTSEISLKGAATRRRNGNMKLSAETKAKISKANKGKPKSALHKQHLSDHHRTHKEKTILFEDGHTEVSAEPLWKIAERFNMTAMELKRASEYDKFRNGIKVIDLKDDTLVEQHNKIENGIFTDPLTNVEMTYKQLRAKKSFNKQYKDVDLLACFTKYNT